MHYRNENSTYGARACVYKSPVRRRRVTERGPRDRALVHFICILMNYKIVKCSQNRAEIVKRSGRIKKPSQGYTMWNEQQQRRQGIGNTCLPQRHVFTTVQSAPLTHARKPPPPPHCKYPRLPENWLSFATLLFQYKAYLCIARGEIIHDFIYWQKIMLNVIIIFVWLPSHPSYSSMLLPFLEIVRSFLAEIEAEYLLSSRWSLSTLSCS